MASKKQVPSFDEFIQNERKRKQNEALANEIFGRGRKPTFNKSRDGSGTTTPNSLASRITPAGVGKRSASASSLRPNKTFSRTVSASTQKAKFDRIGASLANDATQVNIVSSNKSKGISIRGISSGTFHVQASNFAPGTTAADIEAAVLSVVEGATEVTLISCHLITNSPTVIAEITFNNRSVAEEVVNTFNGQRADGRVLHFHLKDPAPGLRTKSAPKGRNNTQDANPPPAAPAQRDLFPVGDDDMAMDEVESSSQTNTYENQRANANREREARRAEPEFQDGTYGFEDPVQREEPRQPSYRGNGNERNDRNERGREQDRNRRYDDRDYQQSRGTPTRREDDTYYGGGQYDRMDERRDTRPPSYNNGGDSRGGRGGRGGWNGNGTGRMYSDSMIGRGGRSRGGRGGYR